MELSTKAIGIVRSPAHEQESSQSPPSLLLSSPTCRINGSLLIYINKQSEAIRLLCWLVEGDFQLVSPPLGTEIFVPFHNGLLSFSL